MSKTRKLVEVFWTDCAFEDEYAERDAEALELVELRTVGYLVADTEEAIVIAMTLCDTDASVATEQIVIPWRMITKWYSINEDLQ